jgi:predicted DNA-binding protein
MKTYQVPLSTKISLATMQALDEYAKSSGQSKASIVEAAINEYLAGQEGQVLVEEEEES